MKALAAIDALVAKARELLLRRGATVGRAPVVLGHVSVYGGGKVVVGDGVRFDCAQAAVELNSGPGAEIVIGDGVVLHAGVSIEALRSVRIGARARIGAFAKIIDNHFHQVEGDRQQAPESVPVVVEEEATIGPRAILLPGAHIGGGTRLGPATVIGRRTPPGVDIEGFPAVTRKRPA